MNRFGIGTHSSRIDSPIISHTQGMLVPVSSMRGMGASAEELAAGKQLSDIMNSMSKTMFPQMTPKEERRLFFRLGELLAKMDPKVAAKGWRYAGYYNNTVDKADQEGADFRSSYGSKGNVLGLEGHMPAGWYEQGRVGERLSIIKSVTETASRLKRAIEAIATSVADRRYVLEALFQQYLPAAYKAGMPDVGTMEPITDPPFWAIMNAPRAKSGGGASTSSPSALSSVASTISNAATGGFSAAVGQQDMAQYEAQQAADGYGDYPPVEEEMSMTTKVIIGASILGLAAGAYYLTKKG